MHNWRPTERLDSVLDRSIDRLDEEDPESILRDYPQSRNTLAPMLHIADALRDLEQVAMRPAAKQAGRERLRKAVLARQRRRPRSALANGLRMAAWVAAFVLICTGTIGGLNRTSANTLPDEPLYAWKRATERVWLGVQFTPEREITVSLALADRRVDEVKRLYQRSGRVYPAIINQLQADYKRTLQLIDTLPPEKAQPLLAQAKVIGAEHEQELMQLAQQATGSEQQILLAAVQVSQWVQHTPPEQAATSPPPIPDETSAAPPTEPAIPGTTAVPGGKPQPTSPGVPPVSEPPSANNPSQQPGGPSVGIPSTPNPTAVAVPPAQKPSAVPQPGRPARPAPTERAKPPRPTARPKPPQAPPTAVPATEAPTDTPSEPGQPGNPTIQPGPTIEPPGAPTPQPGPPNDPPGQSKTPKPTDPPKEEKTPKPTNEPGPPREPPSGPTAQPGPEPPGQSKTPRPTNPPKKDEEPPQPVDPPKQDEEPPQPADPPKGQP